MSGGPTIESKSKMSGMTLGVVFAIVAISIWAGNFVISRGLSGTYAPAVIAFCRWSLAIIIMFPLAAKHIKKDWALILKQKWLIIACGICGTGVYNLLCYTAGRTTSATNLSLLATSSPIFTIIIMRLIFKEKISPKKIFGIILAIFGVACLLVKGDISVLMSLDFTIGDILILLATLLWSIYTILNKYKDPNVSTWSFIFCGFVVAWAITLPFFIGGCVQHGFPEFEKVGIACFFYLAIGCSIISFMLWNKAVLIIGATNASIIYNTIPVFSCFFAFLILGEPILPVQIFSIIVIFAGVTIAQDSIKFGKKKKQDQIE
ncbi:MAG: DMT family transporter [Firmicutes bacterium]|nr:DMT family transporter [Bacillota bacterium]